MPDEQDYDLKPIDYVPRFADDAPEPTPPNRLPSRFGTGEADPRLGPAVAGMARGVMQQYMTPGIVAQPIAPSTPGMWSDEDEARRLATEGRATDWAPKQALNMVGQGAPMAVEGAAGMAGGKLGWISPKQALKMSDEDFAKLRPAVKHSKTGEIRTGMPDQGHNELIGPNAVDADTSSPWQRGFLPAEPTPPIRAYHGSPHDFERFDISKIGTGEGAQSYGHGLYFAEEPKTAESYKLAGPEADRQFSDVNSQLSQLARDIDKAKAEYYRTQNPDAKNAWQDAAKRYDETMEKREKIGRTYEVDINANPEHFLDWDKPFSEQHPKVQEALKSLPFQSHRFEKDALGREQTGADFAPKSDMFVNKYVEAGIPGIKYLDQGSRQPVSDFTVWAPRAGRNEQFEVRGPGNEVRQKFSTREEANAFADSENKRLNPQTSNYVVFDDKLIDIIKKYGLAGLVAGGAGHFATKAVDYDPFADDAKHAKGGAVKLSHASVGYVASSTHLPQECGSCTMFLPPAGCTLVRSPIKAGGWCRRFEKGKHA